MSTTTKTSLTEQQQNLAAGKRRRQLTEALLGYAFVLPAALVTFVFGVWPVVFGFYISLHQWRAGNQNFLGLDQYVRALGNIAYVLLIFLCILFLYGGYRALRGGLREMREGQGNFYLFLLPGLVIAVSLIALSGGVLFQTTKQTAEQAASVMMIGLVLLAIGIGLLWSVNQSQKTPSATKLSVTAIQLALLWLLAAGLFTFTISEIATAHKAPNFILEAAFPDLYIPPLSQQLLATGGVVLALIGILLSRRWLAYLRENDEYSPLINALRTAGVVLRMLIVLLVVYLISAMNFDRVAANTLSDMRRSDANDFGMQATGLMDAESDVYACAICRWAINIGLQATDLEGDEVYRDLYGSHSGDDLSNIFLILPHILSVITGLILLYSAFQTWRRATRSESGWSTGVFISLAFLSAVGGWLFIGELPQAMAVGDIEYYNALLTTTAYSLGTVPIQLTLGLLLAYILFHEIGLGKSVFRMVYFMPYVAPTVATATVFVIIFSQRDTSLANQLIGGASIPAQGWLAESKGIFQILAELIAGPDIELPAFLVGPSLALVSIIIYNIWVFMGYNTVIYLAGLGAIPGELYEAAKVDGAGRWSSFRKITFPLLSPTTFFLTVLGIAGTFRAFSHIYVLRHPGARGAADTASVHIFVQFWQFNQWGYAAAMSFVLFGIILVLTLVQNELSRERVFYG